MQNSPVSMRRMRTHTADALMRQKQPDPARNAARCNARDVLGVSAQRRVSEVMTRARHLCAIRAAKSERREMSGSRVGPLKFDGALCEKRSRRAADCSTLVTFLFASPLGKTC